MKPTIYTCTSHTERRDKANLFYINKATANRIEEDKTETRIYNKSGNIIAIFATA